MKNYNLYTDLNKESCQQINGGCFAHDAGTALKFMLFSASPAGMASVAIEYSIESAAGTYEH